MRDLSEKGYEEVDKQYLSYSLWLRASMLPKVFEEKQTKESSSETCSRSLNFQRDISKIKLGCIYSGGAFH